LRICEDGEEYGQVTDMLGDKRVAVRSFSDGSVVIARISRTFKRRKIFIARDDIVLMAARLIDDGKYDILHRYSIPHVHRLQKLLEIPQDLTLNEGVQDDNDAPSLLPPRISFASNYDLIDSSDDEEGVRVPAAPSSTPVRDNESWTDDDDNGRVDISLI
jgi:initiation factor 1A